MEGEAAKMVQDYLKLKLRTYQVRPTEEPNQWKKHSRHMTDLIHRTAIQGESNSLMIIGPRGAGKSALLDYVLKEVQGDSKVKENLIIVKLHGLIHTDDSIALRDITRQLQLQESVQDKVFSSFSDNLTFLLESLRHGTGKKSVLFILDDFDLFCHHKNQTLLYNLFDTAQQCFEASVIIVGLSCRLDVIELLEKRVKSRFSHRQIHLFNEYSFHEYVNIAQDLLKLVPDSQYTEYKKHWNLNIEKMFREKGVMDVLKQLYTVNKDIRTLKQHLLLSVGLLSEDCPYLQAAQFLTAYRLLRIDSKTTYLNGLSYLQLGLVIAMMHLHIVYDGAPFNFEMVYNEYKKFTTKKAAMYSFDRAVLLKAFEQLQALELVMPIGQSNVLKEYQLMRLQLSTTQIVEALQKFPKLPTELQQWAFSAIV